MVHFGLKKTLLILLCLLSLSSFLYAEQPAGAHTDLLSSNPVPESALVKSPDKIELLFNEKVEIKDDSIRIYNQNGQRIQANKIPKNIDGNKVVLSLGPLDRGLYAVAWNAISSDTHPIRGAFTFSVKETYDSTVASNEKLEAVLKGDTGSSGHDKLGAFFRGLVFLSIAFIVALSIFVFFVFKKMPKHGNSLVYTSVLICILASMGTVAIQASASQELPFHEALAPSVLWDEFSTNFGLANLARILICLIVVIIWKFKSALQPKYLLLVLAGLLSFTPAFTGHARGGLYIPFAVTMSFIHVAATSIWFGGLVLIAMQMRDEKDVEVLKRFSKIAFVSVILILCSGMFAWYRQVGSIDAATSTTFGKILTLKMFLFALVVIIAYFSRRYLSDIHKPDVEKKLFRNLCSEAIIILLIYSLSAVLVNTVPAKEALSAPVTRQAEANDKIIEFIVDPAKSGASELHVYLLNKSGVPYQINREGVGLSDPLITVTMTNAARDIGPLDVNMRFQGLNHFSSLNLNVPFPGEWTITARVNIDRFQQVSASIDVVFK